MVSCGQNRRPIQDVGDHREKGRLQVPGPHHRIRLPDGRRLGFCEVGDPTGKPVFYFHGFPGSRLEVSVAGGVAGKLGLRVIGIDRPGYGLSDFQPGREMNHWPDDVAMLAETLGMDRFAVMGVSGGGPYAAACACLIPDCLSFVGMACGLGPMDAPDSLTGMTQFNRFGLRLAHRRPRLAKAVFRLSSIFLRHFPGYLVKAMSSHLGEPDEAALQQPGIRNTLEISFRESVRQGPRGPFHDLMLYSRPWGFALRDIPIEVNLWHGEQDSIVPPSMGYALGKIIPRCKAAFYPDEGHFSLITRRQGEILGVLAAAVIEE